MDFRSEASPWAIRDLTEDIFGVCSECDHTGITVTHVNHTTGFPCQLRREFLGGGPRCTCIGMCVSLYLAFKSLKFFSLADAAPRVDLACLDVLLDGRHRTPSPSIACIDPRLTVLWPSPPASPSEEESSASVDDSWTAFDDCWDQESPDTRVSECVLDETTTSTLNTEGGSNESNTGPGKSLPISRERELRKTRSTVSC